MFSTIVIQDTLFFGNKQDLMSLFTKMSLEHPNMCIDEKHISFLIVEYFDDLTDILNIFTSGFVNVNHLYNGYTILEYILLNRISYDSDIFNQLLEYLLFQMLPVVFYKGYSSGLLYSLQLAGINLNNAMTIFNKYTDIIDIHEFYIVFYTFFQRAPELVDITIFDQNKLMLPENQPFSKVIEELAQISE
jgi:hypothetical protein